MKKKKLENLRIQPDMKLCNLLHRKEYKRGKNICEEEIRINICFHCHPHM